MLPHFEHRSVENIEFENEKEPTVLWTTAAMGIRLDAQLNVLEAKIEQFMVDIEILAYHNTADNDLGVERGEADHAQKCNKLGYVTAQARLNPLWRTIEAEL